jgi:acyl-CoA oxidase
MPSNPDWVQKLKPAGTTGTELLTMERNKSTLPTRKLTEYLHGVEWLDMRDSILKILESEKVFDKSKNYFSGRIQRFEAALARAKRLRQLADEHDWSLQDHNIAVDLIAEPMPYGLHGTMFLVCFHAGNALELTQDSSHCSVSAAMLKVPNGLVKP